MQLIDRVCKTCGVLLVLHSNWSEGHAKIHWYGCDSCNRKEAKEGMRRRTGFYDRHPEQRGTITALLGCGSVTVADGKKRITTPTDDFMEQQIAEDTEGQVNQQSKVPYGHVYAGWIRHYGSNINTVGKALRLHERKRGHQRDCPYKDFAYLPTCTLFVYNRAKAEKALLKLFKSKFPKTHPKGDWFICTRQEAIAAFHEFVQFYTNEEE